MFSRAIQVNNAKLAQRLSATTNVTTIGIGGNHPNQIINNNNNPLIDPHVIAKYYNQAIVTLPTRSFCTIFRRFHQRTMTTKTTTTTTMAQTKKTMSHNQYKTTTTQPLSQQQYRRLATQEQRPPTNNLPPQPPLPFANAATTAAKTTEQVIQAAATATATTTKGKKPNALITKIKSSKLYNRLFAPIVRIFDKPRQFVRKFGRYIWIAFKYLFAIFMLYKSIDAYAQPSTRDVWTFVLNLRGADQDIMKYYGEVDMSLKELIVDFGQNPLHQPIDQQPLPAFVIPEKFSPRDTDTPKVAKWKRKQIRRAEKKYKIMLATIKKYPEKKAEILALYKKLEIDKYERGRTKNGKKIPYKTRHFYDKGFKQRLPRIILQCYESCRDYDDISKKVNAFRQLLMKESFAVRLDFHDLSLLLQRNEVAVKEIQTKLKKMYKTELQPVQTQVYYNDPSHFIKQQKAKEQDLPTVIIPDEVKHMLKNVREQTNLLYHEYQEFQKNRKELAKQLLEKQILSQGPNATERDKSIYLTMKDQYKYIEAKTLAFGRLFYQRIQQEADTEVTILEKYDIPQYQLSDRDFLIKKLNDLLSAQKKCQRQLKIQSMLLYITEFTQCVATSPPIDPHSATFQSKVNSLIETALLTPSWWSIVSSLRKSSAATLYQWTRVVENIEFFNNALDHLEKRQLEMDEKVQKIIKEEEKEKAGGENKTQNNNDIQNDDALFNSMYNIEKNQFEQPWNSKVYHKGIINVPHYSMKGKRTLEDCIEISHLTAAFTSVVPVATQTSFKLYKERKRLYMLQEQQHHFRQIRMQEQWVMEQKLSTGYALINEVSGVTKPEDAYFRKFIRKTDHNGIHTIEKFFEKFQGDPEHPVNNNDNNNNGQQQEQNKRLGLDLNGNQLIDASSVIDLPQRDDMDEISMVEELEKMALDLLKQNQNNPYFKAQQRSDNYVDNILYLNDNDEQENFNNQKLQQQNSNKKITELEPHDITKIFGDLNDKTAEPRDVKMLVDLVNSGIKGGGGLLGSDSNNAVILPSSNTKQTIDEKLQNEHLLQNNPTMKLYKTLLATRQADRVPLPLESQIHVNIYNTTLLEKLRLEAIKAEEKADLLLKRVENIQTYGNPNGNTNNNDDNNPTNTSSKIPLMMTSQIPTTDPQTGKPLTKRQQQELLQQKIQRQEERYRESLLALPFIGETEFALFPMFAGKFTSHPRVPLRPTRYKDQPVPDYDNDEYLARLVPNLKSFKRLMLNHYKEEQRYLKDLHKRRVQRLTDRRIKQIFETDGMKPELVAQINERIAKKRAKILELAKQQEKEENRKSTTIFEKLWNLASPWEEKSLLDGENDPVLNKKSKKKPKLNAVQRAEIKKAIFDTETGSLVDIMAKELGFDKDNIDWNSYSHVRQNIIKAMKIPTIQVDLNKLLTPEQIEILKKLTDYVELTPSGTALRSVNLDDIILQNTIQHFPTLTPENVLFFVSKIKLNQFIVDFDITLIDPVLNRVVDEQTRRVLYDYHQGDIQREEQRKLMIKTGVKDGSIPTIHTNVEQYVKKYGKILHKRLDNIGRVMVRNILHHTQEQVQEITEERDLLLQPLKQHYSKKQQITAAEEKYNVSPFETPEQLERRKRREDKQQQMLDVILKRRPVLFYKRFADPTTYTFSDVEKAYYDVVLNLDLVDEEYAPTDEEMQNILFPTKTQDDDDDDDDASGQEDGKKQQKRSTKNKSQIYSFGGGRIQYADTYPKRDEVEGVYSIDYDEDKVQPGEHMKPQLFGGLQGLLSQIRDEKKITLQDIYGPDENPFNKVSKSDNIDGDDDYNDEDLDGLEPKLKNIFLSQKQQRKEHNKDNNKSSTSNSLDEDIYNFYKSYGDNITNPEDYFVSPNDKHGMQELRQWFNDWSHPDDILAAKLQWIEHLNEKRAANGQNILSAFEFDQYVQKTFTPRERREFEIVMHQDLASMNLIMDKNNIIVDRDTRKPVATIKRYGDVLIPGIQHGVKLTIDEQQRINELLQQQQNLLTMNKKTSKDTIINKNKNILNNTPTNELEEQLQDELTIQKKPTKLEEFSQNASLSQQQQLNTKRIASSKSANNNNDDEIDILDSSQDYLDALISKDPDAQSRLQRLGLTNVQDSTSSVHLFILDQAEVVVGDDDNENNKKKLPNTLIRPEQVIPGHVDPNLPPALNIQRINDNSGSKATNPALLHFEKRQQSEENKIKLTQQYHLQQQREDEQFDYEQQLAEDELQHMDETRRARKKRRRKQQKEQQQIEQNSPEAIEAKKRQRELEKLEKKIQKRKTLFDDLESVLVEDRNVDKDEQEFIQFGRKHLIPERPDMRPPEMRHHPLDDLE